MKKQFISAVLALAGLTASLNAQITATVSDLILGFRASGGQGQNVNLEVDLGSITQFYNQPAGTKLALPKLAVADLTSNYGSNWASRTDLVWGVVGTTSRTATGPNSQPASTLWATQPETAAGTQTTPWTVGSASAQAVAAATIEPLYNSAPGSLGGKTATSNSTAAAVISTNLSGSYSSQDTIQPGESFQYFNPTVDATLGIQTGAYSAADLYELRPGTGNATFLGTFGLKSDGTLTFATSPATFAGISGNEVFTTQPANAQIVSGTTVVFSAAATGTPTPTYQWYFNGVAISGQTGPRLVISNATGANAGSYTVAATNSTGSVTSNSATLSIAGATTNPGRLVNLSILSNISGSLSMGFVNGGAGTSGQESLLIRGIGPAIGPGTLFNVGGVMPDPTLTVVAQVAHTTVASNAGWGTPSSNVTPVQTADAATGAFALTDTTSADSATVVSLPSVGGGYSATVSGKSGDGGYALTEVYDNTTLYTTASTRLINLSCLSTIPASGSLNVGFVTGGTTAKTVLIRASGPTLAVAPFGLGGTMPDPQLSVTLLGGTTVLAANAAWAGDTGLSAAATAVSAFAFASNTSKDSAVLMTLQPNTGYQVTVSSVSGAGGQVLVEVYEVP